MTISNLFSLATGLVLFLFGMDIMSDSLQRAAGSQLESMLSLLTSNPLKCVTLGTGVTAIIQSSSATSVMVVGFVNSGVMKLRQAIQIILGAILGTSVTGWVVALSSLSGGSGWVALLSTETIVGIMAIIGIFIYTKKKTNAMIGEVLLGFAVLMTGITLMSSSVSPLADSPRFIEIMTKFSSPILGIVVGALCTAVLQSASAAVGILQALSATGAIDFSTAFPLLLGISIGASVPVLLTSLSASTEGKRTAFSYLTMLVIGVGVTSLIFYPVNAAVGFSFMGMTMGPASIALVNTIFRLFVVILLMPLTGQVEKIVCKLVPDQPIPDDGLPHTIKLDERLLSIPAIAISESTRAIDDMAAAARTSVGYAFDLLNEYDEEKVTKVIQFEDLTDQYENEIGSYLMQITQSALTEEENSQVFCYMQSLTDFERINDYAMKIACIYRDINESGQQLPEETVSELYSIQRALRELVETTFDSYSNEASANERPAALSVVVRAMCRRMETKQVDHIQNGYYTIQQGTYISELLTAYGFIVTHTSKLAFAARDPKTSSFRKFSDEHSFDFSNSSAVQALNEYRKKYNIASAADADPETDIASDYANRIKTLRARRIENLRALRENSGKLDLSRFTDLRDKVSQGIADLSDVADQNTVDLVADLVADITDDDIVSAIADDTL